MSKAIEQAFRLWLQEGLLDSSQVDALRSSLQRDHQSRSSPAVTLIATFGSVLVGLGIVLFVGSNWSGMGPVARVFSIFSAYLLSVAMAFLAQHRGLPRVADSLWLLTSLSIGAYIFLLAQIFNQSLTFWQAPFLWMCAALAMGYARDSTAHGMLAVPLALLTLGWYGGGSGWFMDDQMEFLVSSAGLRPLFPLIGAGLVAVAMLASGVHNKSLRFLLSASRFWGATLVAVPLIVASIDESIMRGLFEIDWSVKQIVIVCAVFALIGATFRNLRKLPGLLMFGFSAILLIMLIRPGTGGNLFEWVAGHQVAYGAAIIAMFAMSVGAAALGARLMSKVMINYGVASAGIIIFVQYFSWSFLLLQRSLAFVVGGVLLIVTAIFLESQRRSLISRISAREGLA